MMGPTAIVLPLAAIDFDIAAFPRRGLDHIRIAEMVQLYSDGGPTALPPPEFVALGGGRHAPADGWHRCHAALALRWDSIHGLVLEVPSDVEPLEFAYLRGLETAATAAKPLLRTERHAAICRLIQARPDWADREIARRVGVSHQTVGRIRASLRTNPDVPQVEVADSYLAYVTAEKVTDQLVRGLAKAWNERGITDLVMHRMPTSLSRSLRRTFGDEAPVWADRLEQWAFDARAQLDQVND